MLINRLAGLVLPASSKFLIDNVIGKHQAALLPILVLAAFGGAMAYAFTRLRPLFRERGKIQAEVTGRLAESLGGIRIVKAYTAEKREELIFTRGVHRLLRNVAKSMTGVSAVMAF